jgi:tetratricopeptide (TPR) repeat protein
MSTIAALLLPFALLQSAATVEANRFEQCLAQIESNAERAYEEGMAWAAEGQSLSAYRCAALALIRMERYHEGARRLESLARSISASNTALQADLFSQAGNAWLLAREPGNARSAFSQAISTIGADPAQLPDLLIDRARAYAMEEDWRHAEEDLSRALDIRADDPLALRLRAAARMHQNSFQLAESDALAATRIEPENVDNFLVLGHVRESIRTGAPVDEQ